MKVELRDYQKLVVKFLLQHKESAILLDMGLGKTIIILMFLQYLDLLEDHGKTLIIAPLSVARNTWPDEIEKWEDTKELTYSLVLGSEDDRTRALLKKADIYIINRENVEWLVDYFGSGWDFETVVIDELSSFKNPKAKRFKALRKARPFMKRIIGLTGTPAPNSLLDLWSEMYLLDMGERLGKTLTSYRSNYFHAGQQSGYVVYKWVLNDGAEEQIYDKINDITISMKAKDFLKLPKRTNNTVTVQMTEKEEEQYHELSRTFVLNAFNGEEITASNAAVLSNKLLQLANGAIYDDEGNTVIIHDHKLDALSEIIEEAQGQPVLVFYQYKQDRDRILKKFKDAKALDPKSDDIKKWNQGKIPILLAQPQSTGHGLNLQMGGHIIAWFGLTWSLEYYQQANARLDRQGQTKPVIVHHLITKNTIDERVIDVLQGKAEKQDNLLAALKAVKDEIEEEQK